MTVKITDENYIPELTKEIAILRGKKINVGVKAPSGDEVFMIANAHEYGAYIKVTKKMRGWFLGQGMPLKKSTTHIKIPERSFLRTGYDKNKNSIETVCIEAIEQVLSKGISAYEARKRVGEFAVDKIKSNITGVGLVKTGRLRNSIGFRVVKK